MHRPTLAFLLTATAAWVGWSLPAPAQTLQEAPQVSYHMGAPAGIRRLRPETWGLVGVSAVNAGDQPAEVLATLYFAEDQNLQYARRLWIPARSKRQSWCPVFAPPSVSPFPATHLDQPENVQVGSLLFDASAASDVPIKDPRERRPDRGLVSIHHTRVVTAVISDGGASDEAYAAVRAVFEMVAAAKVSAGHSDAFPDLFEDFLPPVLESWDGLDQLVLASDRLALDPAALRAIRRWLVGGGHLWIMLDQVDPATVELLLGDGAEVRVVDRVGLTEVLVEQTGPSAGPPEPEARQFEQPVELVRVVAADAEVTHRVNGWPVSFRKPMGRGSVLFTALGPRAWIRPRKPGDIEPGKRHIASPYVATAQLERIASKFFEPGEGPAIEPRKLEPYLAEQIGYRIVSRGSVVGVLGGFCLVLLGSGTWLARRKRLDKMTWVVPLASAAAAGLLIMMGGLARKTVPPTVAVAQLAEVDSQADEVHVTGLLAMYQQESSAGPFGARGGGIFSPDMTGLEGTTRRMVRTDLDAWHWERLVLPVGVRTAPFTCATSADRRVAARAAFGPDGLSGAVSRGPFERLDDAVIALPWHGCLAAKLGAEGEFTSGSGDVLAAGQFISGALLNDEQRRRQQIYEQILSPAVRGRYPDRPKLFAWAPPLDAQFRFPEGVQRVGSALVAVPLEIERTPPGTEVVVPSPFLSFRSVGLAGGTPSAAFSNSVQEWIEMRAPSTACLRFQIPQQVLPIALERASLTIRINAPSRKMEVLAFRGDQPVTVATRTGPVRSLEFDVAESELLELDERGGLLLGIGIDREAGADRQTAVVRPTGSAWKIEAVELEVAGTTLRADE